MLRAVIFIVIVAVLILVAALASGLLRIRPAPAGNVTAKAAQSPPFEVQTGSVHVGTHTTTVKVPDVHVTPPAESSGNQPASEPANRD